MKCPKCNGDTLILMPSGICKGCEEVSVTVRDIMGFGDEPVRKPLQWGTNAKERVYKREYRRSKRPTHYEDGREAVATWKLDKKMRNRKRKKKI